MTGVQTCALPIYEIYVATDDERIFNHVTTLGCKAMMTSINHASGTDRCAEAAQHLTDYEFVINIQGDEPFIHPHQIDLVIELLRSDEQSQIATLCKKIVDVKELLNPNVVKVIATHLGDALYFSRHPIPFVRSEKNSELWLSHADFFKHIGLYGFRRDVLLAVAQLTVSPSEAAESLEQLRWLEARYRISIAETSYESRGIDSPEDL